MPDQLIPAVPFLISSNVKLVPEHLDRFINSDAVSGELVLIEFVGEIVRVELLPVDHDRTYASNAFEMKFTTNRHPFQYSDTTS